MYDYKVNNTTLSFQCSINLKSVIIIVVTVVRLDAGNFCEESNDACEQQPCGLNGTCVNDLAVNQTNNRGYRCTSCDEGYQLTNDSKCEGWYN